MKIILIGVIAIVVLAAGVFVYALVRAVRNLNA